VKRTLVLAVAASLLATGAATATAAPTKAKGPKPVSSTMFFHGSQPVGEVEGSAASAFLPMDTTAPTGSDAKSYGVTNFVAGPNTQCSGNAYFPTWTGAIDGAPTGATLEVHTQGAGGGTVTASLFADVFETLACNDAFVPPIGTATFTVPDGAGVVKVDFKNLNKKRKNYSNLVLMIAPSEALPVPFVARVNYDSTSAASKLVLSCLPKAGKKTC
jgi:hypothetical protein